MLCNSNINRNKGICNSLFSGQYGIAVERSVLLSEKLRFCKGFVVAVGIFAGAVEENNLD